MPNITIGVCLLVIRKDRLLVARRLNNFGRGYLCVPGGHHEFGETRTHRALRETEEEAGDKLKVKIRPFFQEKMASESNVPWFVTNNIIEGGRTHCITSWLVADWVSGEAVNMERHKKSEWMWFTLNDIIEDPPIAAALSQANFGADAFHWMPVPELFKFQKELWL